MLLVNDLTFKNGKIKFSTICVEENVDKSVYEGFRYHLVYFVCFDVDKNSVKLVFYIKRVLTSADDNDDNEVFEKSSNLSCFTLLLTGLSKAVCPKESYFTFLLLSMMLLSLMMCEIICVIVLNLVSVEWVAGLGLESLESNEVDKANEPSVEVEEAFYDQVGFVCSKDDPELDLLSHLLLMNSSKNRLSCKPKPKILLLSSVGLRAPMHTALTLIRNFFSYCDRNQLSRCGDVEVNPGPIPVPMPTQTPTLMPMPMMTPTSRSMPRQREKDQDQDGTNGNQGHSGKTTKAQLQVLTQNVRGLGCTKKVRHLVNSCYKLCKKANDNVFAFQETYVASLDLLKYIWRGEFYVTGGTGNSQGCITLVSAPYKILHAVDIGQRGHILVLTKNDINRAELLIVNVYAPNGFDAEKLQFFENLAERIGDIRQAYNCNNVILLGDLNIVFKPTEVQNRMICSAERRISQQVSLMWQTLNLTDVWDLTTDRNFTWASNRTGTPSFSTLDRVLFNCDHWELETVNADWALSISDHAAVVAKFKTLNNRQAKSSLISRLDPRLLLDAGAIEVLNQSFQELHSQRSDNWNPHVSLEYCKMCIRTAVNTAAGTVKAKFRDDEHDLNKDINEIVDELSNADTPADRKVLLSHKLDDLRMLKRKLVEKIGSRLERRTARQWYNEGELSNKYFFNLLNRKANDEINSIVNGRGEEISNPVQIEEEIRSFYKDLYESVPDQVLIEDDFFRNIVAVDREAAGDVTRCITLSELEETLRSCDDSSPGPDGIPYSYWRHFWQDTGGILLNAWNYSLLIKELPPSHKVSYLRLIPKVGKDQRIIANLRPITLSNTDHKLITKTYARKLTKAVAERIGEEQTAYIPGRLINDNVRAMLMTLDLANVDQDVDGVVVSLDAKKAFDSVDHRFIRKSLEVFGLKDFIPVFDTLYKGLESRIIINGKTVKGFNILKGVKQGDALSCILFIICMEPLIRNLNENAMIERIRSEHLRVVLPKTYGYADDISVVAKRSERAVQEIFVEYEAFTKASGLLLNADKTEILCFNHGRVNYDFNIAYLGNNFQLQPADTVKINGILLTQDINRREVINVQKVYDAMERHLRAWSTRTLTLIGRILIIKTFAMSQAVYLLQSMSLQDSSIKKLMTLIFKFLWNKNFNAARAPDRIKRSIMLTPVKLGGFGLVDLNDVARALDLRSYGRLQVTKHPLFVQLKDRLRLGDFFNLKLDGNADSKLKKSIVLLNEARRKVLSWPLNCMLSDVNLRTILLETKVGCLLTLAGKRSLHYLAIHRRCRNAAIKDVTLLEFRSIERFLVYPSLASAIKDIISGVNVVMQSPIINAANAYPSRHCTLLDIEKISSKNLRQNMCDANPICIYKLGPLLTPGEVLYWTDKLKRLTSTRHRNILLRAMHGDIYSNERLFRFGLVNSPGCANCDEPVETIVHRLVTCTKARETWQKLDEIKSVLGLTITSDHSIENLVGAKEPVSNLDLALQAEVILKLSTKGEGYCPSQLARAATLLVCRSEKLKPDIKERFDAYKNSV